MSEEVPITHTSEETELSSRKFVAGCVLISITILVFGRGRMAVEWLAIEVFVTIIGLFVFGSFHYRLHKNALTYGMALVIIATFVGLSTSPWHAEIAECGGWAWTQRHLFSFQGWNELVHADTMLFILGLTFFVAVIAQTRLLEQATFFLLRCNRGRVLPTVVAVTASVAVASGILDGVSMIGLTIRTLVILLLLAAAPTALIRYAVMVCTVITTVCGIWLAYGEPPNLIMKANLHPHLTNSFFLRYCAPAAVVSYLVIAWNLRRKFGGGWRVELQTMDVLDTHIATVRFMQAERHGEVLTPVEFIEDHASELGVPVMPVRTRIQRGEPMGEALVREHVSEATRKRLLGKFVCEDLAETLDHCYVLRVEGDEQAASRADAVAEEAIVRLRRRRHRAGIIGTMALLPFVGGLIWHGMNHNTPLFLASFAGFSVAILGIWDIPKMRTLALREAWCEFAEYYFLFPLFLSITLLTKAGFFSQLQSLLQEGIRSVGCAPMAVAQFFGCTFLSSILDNNVVADFASRALYGLEVGVLHLFAMSQIAGYAAGGCWTHIGSAQSVVAFAFIRRDVDKRYTPIQWIREMTPVILEICALLVLVIFVESMLLR